MATTSEHIQPSLPSQLVVLEGDQKAVVKIQIFLHTGCVVKFNPIPINFIKICCLTRGSDFRFRLKIAMLALMFQRIPTSTSPCSTLKIIANWHFCPSTVFRRTVAALQVLLEPCQSTSFGSLMQRVVIQQADLQGHTFAAHISTIIVSKILRSKETSRTYCLQEPSRSRR